MSFLVLNGGALLVSAILAGASGGRTSRLLLQTLSGYLIVVHSLTLLAGLGGHLTVGGVAGLLAMAMAGALWWARRTARTVPLETEESANDGGRVTAASSFAPLAAVMAAIVWAWPHFFGATRLWIWDDYTYHVVYPALWLREQTIAATTPAEAFTMQAWYPLSASVVASWFMLPFHGLRGEALAWVSLTGPLLAAIVASAAVDLLTRVGCRPGAWAVPILLFATSHRTAIMASSFSDTDLAQAALLFAAFAFAVPSREGVSGRDDVMVDACYAALLTGLALGVKVSAAPVALIIVVMLALRARRRWRAVARVIVVVVASWTVTGGYWYVRNAVHTGNPVYPAAFLVWPGTTFPETTLLEYSRHYGVRRALADALVVYMNWPRVHATLAITGLVLLAGWIALHRRTPTRCQRYFAYGTLAAVAVILIALPTAPYSAGNAMTFRSGFIHWDSMRYVALLPILGWVALGFAVDAGAGARPWRTLAAVVIATVGLLTSDNPWLSSPLVLVGLALGAMLLASARLHVRRRRPLTVRGTALAASAVALVVAGVVTWSHTGKATATATAFHREPLFGAAAAVLDRQPGGTRVAVFGDQWIYPTFGARGDLVPVRLDRDGLVATTPIGDAMAPGNLTVDPPTFLSNLRTSRIDLVVVVHLPHPGRSPEWPTQHGALERTGAASLLHRDAAVAIWKLAR